MAEVIGSILIVLGLAYKVLIRAPYTHNKQTFSVIRNTMTYIRLLLILLYKEVLVGVQYRNLDIKILKSIPHLNLFIVVEASCCSWMGG